MRKATFVLAMSIFLLVVQGRAYAIDISSSVSFSKPVKSLKAIKNKNVINQSRDYSCGPASLATMLTYYFGDKVTEKEIIKFLLLTTDLQKVKEKKGFSLLDLKDFAQYRGYDVDGYRMDLEYLLSLDKPVLIPVNLKDYSHFVVFRGMRGDRVFLADPALGNMTMRVDKFLGLWRDGIGLVLSKANYHPVKTAALELTEEEKAVFADPDLVRSIFGMDIIGNVYEEGEF